MTNKSHLFSASETKSIAIVGGGRLCKRFLTMLFENEFILNTPEVKGVADIKTEAVGLALAREKGIFVTQDYRNFNQIPGLQIILELTRNESLAEQIRCNFTGNIQVIDHYRTMAWWDDLQIEAEMRRTICTLRAESGLQEKIEDLFLSFAKNIRNILKRRCDYSERIERNLTENEQIMHQIIQGSTIPTFVINQDHIVTHWNTALEKLSGYPADKIVGTKKQSLPFWKEDRPSMADVVLDQMTEAEIKALYGAKWNKSALIENAYEAEIFFPNLGGHGKWCFFTAAPIKAPDGAFIGAIETLQDTTDKKFAEAELERQNQELAHKAKALQEREQTMAQIIQGSTIPIFVIDQHHIITHWNKALEKLSGYSAEEMVGTRKQALPFWRTDRPSMADVILDQPDESELERLYGDQWKKSALIEGAYEAEIFFPNLGEHGKWCFFTAAPIKDPDGKIIGAIETFWDTSEKKQAEEERENRNRELTLLQEELIRKTNFQTRLIRSSNDGIVATNENMEVVIFNPGAERIFGYQRDEVVNQMSVAKLYPEELVQEFKKRMASVDRGGDFSANEVTIIAKTREKIPVRISGSVLYEKARVMGTVAFFMDLREIKCLEKELIQTEKMAAIGQTVAGMAHCIKNILHGFKGGSYLVDIGVNKQDSEKLKSGWQIIQRNIGRTSELVMDLLYYSKEREAEYNPCAPNDIVKEICAVLSETAKENDIEIVSILDPSIEQVAMDQQMVYRILLNLAANALDACIFDGSEQKHWRVSLKTVREPNDYIRFEITDNGAGMNQETQEKLFNSFFSTKGAKGTGLGLLVTRKLIDEHGGVIDFTTKHHQGTTFTVRLPFLPITEGIAKKSSRKN